MFSSAKSLTLGNGYRILSLPEQPSQTKYPILYPLYLSLIWRLSPTFPENLHLAIWFTWPTVVLCLALAWRYYRREWGFQEAELWIALALLATSPYMLLYGCTMLSEIPFTCCLLTVLLLISRDGTRWAIAAGFVAGCAYLLRTSGVPLLVSIPAWYWWKKSPRAAGAFAASMLPFVVGWSLWSRTQALHTVDPTLTYYTDYIRYELLNVGFDNLHIVVWRNTDALLYAMGSLFLPKVFGGELWKILAQVIAIAMISGVVRLARRGLGLPYALYGALSGAMLIIWQYPPDERFLIPVFPLLLAGLITEAQHLIGLIRDALQHKEASQRLVAAGFASSLSLLLITGLGLQAYVTIYYLGDGQTEREKVARLQTAYHWISQNLPPDAAILSNDDPLLYLYTGHRGNLVLPLTRDWCYGDPRSSILNTYRNIADLARRRGLSYIFTAPGDLVRMTRDAEVTAEVESAMHNSPDLIPVYQGPSGTIYKVREAR